MFLVTRSWFLSLKGVKLINWSTFYIEQFNSSNSQTQNHSVGQPSEASGIDDISSAGINDHGATATGLGNSNASSGGLNDSGAISGQVNDPDIATGGATTEALSVWSLSIHNTVYMTGTNEIYISTFQYERMHCPLVIATPTVNGHLQYVLKSFGNVVMGAFYVVYNVHSQIVNT